MNSGYADTTSDERSAQQTARRSMPCFVLSTANDSSLYTSTELEISDASGNSFGAEITTLIGLLDRRFVLKLSLVVVSIVVENGVEVFAPDLGATEFGSDYAEAIDNLISYMVADFEFLSGAEESDLTGDAKDRLEMYLTYLDPECCR